MNTNVLSVIPNSKFCINQLRSRMLSVAQLSIVSELWDFLKVRKKWWLAPILILFLLLGGLIILTQGSALAPFIYAIF